MSSLIFIFENFAKVPAGVVSATPASALTLALTSIRANLRQKVVAVWTVARTDHPKLYGTNQPLLGNVSLEPLTNKK